MGGFWNALSVLAPVAPALSDAQDIRADRAKEAQELELRKAQTTVEQFAGQEAQQRLRAGNQPIYKPGSQPEYSSVLGTMAQPVWNGNKWELQTVPGDTPQQQEKYQLESVAKNRAAAKSTMPPGTSDETLDYLSYALSGLKPPVDKVIQMSGDAGKPFKGLDGQYYVKGKNANGTGVDIPMGPNYQPPAPKTSSPTAQYANLLTKQILANKKQGPPLTNEEAAQLPALQSALTLPGIARMKAMAEYNAQNHLQVATGDDGQDILIPVAAGIAAFNQGQAYGGPGIGSATGMDKKNQQLAQSAIQQVDRMESILRADPSLTGPGSGQLTKLQMWLGTQDPDAQQFLISSLLGSEHGVAVFGGRNVHTIQDLNDALGSMKTNPAALTGALEVVRETMQPWLTANNRLKNPRAAGGAGGAGAASTTYKQTATGPGGHKIGSNDGGITWYDVKTGKKI
jgi:hypothetical protein